MAAPLNTCTTIEQRGVVRFLWAKYMDAAKDIHKEMLPNGHVVLSAAVPLQNILAARTICKECWEKGVVCADWDKLLSCIMNFSLLHIGMYFVWPVHAVYNQVLACLQVWGTTSVKPTGFKIVTQIRMGCLLYGHQCAGCVWMFGSVWMAARCGERKLMVYVYMWLGWLADIPMKFNFSRKSGNCGQHNY
jgi:hypothetical protein